MTSPRYGPRPVCVLGPGRSGTSLAARVVNLLGVDLGSEDGMLPASDFNPAGFWEQREIVELNEEILVACGGTWLRPPSSSPGWETRPEMAPFAARIAELVARRFGESRRWGFKDPRTTLTLPLWRSAVGDFDHVICLRNPVEVLDSAGDGLPPGDLGMAIWAHYTCEALRATAGRRRMFVFYEDWSVDPVAVGRSIGRFLHGTADAVDPGTWERVDRAFENGLHRQRVGEAELAGRADIPVEVRSLHYLVRDLASAEARGDRERARALQEFAATLDRSPSLGAILRAWREE